MAYKPRKDIKVSESYIQKLRDAGSKKAALEKYGSSSDPKMREALRRFYGASAPAPMKDSSRATARTLPKKSIPMKTVAQAKPSRTGMAPRGGTATKPKSKTSGKSVAQKLDTAARNVYKYAGPENFIAGGAALRAGRIANKAAKSASVSKNTKILKTATGSKANLARTKVGYAQNMATKGEVKQAKAAVKSTTAQKASSAARTGMDTAKYYGSAAKNASTRAQKAGEMRSTQQAVAGAAKKKATSLKRAETTRVKKATSAMMGTAKIDKAKAAAKRASKAGK